MDGFLFALGLIPAVMFALGMINVLEHYGALRAARRLLPVRQSRFDNKLAKHAGLGEKSFVKAARDHLVELGGVTTGPYDRPRSEDRICLSGSLSSMQA